MSDNNIKDLIHIIKTSLCNSDVPFFYLSTEGTLERAGAEFNSSPSEKEIEWLDQWHLPDDYLYFMKQFNGAKIFSYYDDDELETSSGLDIIDIAQAKEIKEIPEYVPENLIPIGYYRGEDMVTIDLEKVQADNENYIVIFTITDSIPLNLNFTNFVNYFISYSGDPFWETFYHIMDIEE